MTPAQTVGTSSIGIVIGLLGGLFGKGGSAVATPLLRLIGLPGFVAVASPLPATTPSTMVSAIAYWRAQMVDWQVVRWGIAAGLPATAAGALLSQYTGSPALLVLTALLVLGFGISFLLQREKQVSSDVEDGQPSFWRTRLALIAIAVGFISGLLANSGGFLLAPLYARVLKLRIKVAFACSLVVSAALSIPGTLVHWYLGHISWLVALLVALGSVPFAYAGARLALKTRSARLERWYGVALTCLGIFFLFHH